jgi:G3E family GTPase
MRVTILSGFLGSGKTTLLRRLLRVAASTRFGVIVNDMSELEVDGDLVRHADTHHERLGNFRAINAGSISGTQKEAFGEVLTEWKGRADLDYVVIETSGSTHPGPMIQEIEKHPEYQLDTFVTLIDAKTFINDYASGQAMSEQAVTEVPLMLAQIRLASVILLTKTEKLKPEALQHIVTHLTKLNEHAVFYAVTYGQIKPALLLGTGRFNAAQAKALAAEWQQAEVGDSGHYDIESDVICDPRPLHPQRLWQLYCEQLGRGIYRSKGFIWLPTRDRDVLLWNQAGGSIEMELTAYWKAALVKNPDGKLHPEEISALQEMLKAAHPVFGDRACELTVIGTRQDREVFTVALKKCFCTEAEISHWQAGGSFDDPWPKKLRMLA